MNSGVSSSPSVAFPGTALDEDTFAGTVSGGDISADSAACYSGFAAVDNIRCDSRGSCLGQLVSVLVVD